jgi:hypothetical protein
MSMAKKSAPAVTILCSRPGFRRAGIVHPAEASYAAGELTDEQLAAIKADATFAVIVAPAPPVTGTGAST